VKRNVYYDWEFYDDGQTIEPVSIGVVDEDGDQYYAVFEGAPMRKMLAHPFHRDHIVPYLPTKLVHPHPDSANVSPRIALDGSHPDVKSGLQIRDEVLKFMTKDGRMPRLWAYFASYDHVTLAQLWGPMVNMPSLLPKRTNDLAQEMERLGLDIGDMPDQEGRLHKAIDDAIWNRQAHQFLIEYAEENDRA
jgi:hypothetical protein